MMLSDFVHSLFETPHPRVRAGMAVAGALALPVAFHGDGVLTVATMVAGGVAVGVASVLR